MLVCWQKLKPFTVLIVCFSLLCGGPHDNPLQVGYGPWAGLVHHWYTEQYHSSNINKWYVNMSPLWPKFTTTFPMFVCCVFNVFFLFFSHCNSVRLSCCIKRLLDFDLNQRTNEPTNQLFKQPILHSDKKRNKQLKFSPRGCYHISCNQSNKLE